MSKMTLTIENYGHPIAGHEKLMRLAKSVECFETLHALYKYRHACAMMRARLKSGRRFAR